MTAYAFHPDAVADLDEIWDYIAEDNIDAAERVPTLPVRMVECPRFHNHPTDRRDPPPRQVTGLLVLLGGR